MAENKTQPTGQDIADFLDAITDPARQADCRTLAELMQRLTGWAPEIWRGNMVGYGRYRYRYASGHGGECFVTGFSPRKQDLTVYIMPGYADFEAILARLGKHKMGKSCLYLKSLAQVDMAVLEELIVAGLARMQQLHGPDITPT
ncbi:DUF1801 domain-containing protein [Chitinimonas sp. BJYL2]|uniref:DUF1801 domain-containing protein n=1 Tax=Chitinimonas sp. BJYL2 TaxID=2976696 RepID=UPI0022B5AF55|nr:DUF1801 domain-containing protein [Chitinimonas sp. BJYL2]